METTFDLMNFGAGFGVCLILLLIVLIDRFKLSSATKKEIQDLKNYLHNHMSIHAKGYEELNQEVEKLKKQNENLRITLATLSSKPGKAEIKTLHTWEKAIKTLTLQSPGFAPAWEMAITEAKKEIEESEKGVKALVHKVFAFLPTETVKTTTDSQ